MKRRILSLLLFAALSSPFTLFAQNEGDKEPAAPRAPQYGLGDQTFSMSAGIFLPLFFFGGGSAVPTNLTIGGAGALSWGAFLNSHVTLGGELSGSFSFTPLKRTLAVIPVTVKLSYFFFIPPFEIPLSLGAGVEFTTLDDMFYVGLVVKPGVSFYWRINPNWALGLNTQYWFVPQWYTKPDLVGQSRYGNFMDISLSAMYHF